MNIFPPCPYFTLIVNRFITTFRLAKHQHVAIANPAPAQIMHIKNDESSQYSQSHTAVKCINVVHYRPTSNRLQQMEQFETVQL